MAKKGDGILIMELARGTAKNEAAAAAGVSYTTVNRRLKDPEFRRLVSQQRRLFLDVAAGILARASAGAAAVLEELIGDKEMAGHVRRSAARDILDHAMRLREAGELEERIQRLEAIAYSEKGISHNQTGGY